MTTPAAPAVAAEVGVTPLAPTSPLAAVTPPTTEQPAVPLAPAPEAIGAEPVVNAVPDASADGQAFTYRDTGDTGLDVALSFIGQLGFGPEHPAVVDAIEGKFDKLEAHLGTLGAPAAGWERMVGLAKDAYARNTAATAATQGTITAAVTEVAGSAANWEAVKAWAGKTAKVDEKAVFNAMLSAGPVQARAAARELVNLYNSAGGTVVLPAAAVVDTTGGAIPNGNGALSPAAYHTAVRELRASLGGRDLDNSPAYQTLKARRQAWRG